MASTKRYLKLPRVFVRDEEALERRLFGHLFGFVYRPKRTSGELSDTAECAKPNSLL